MLRLIPPTLKKTLLFCLLYSAITPAFADDGISDFFDEIASYLEQTTIDGDLRSYYFIRDYTAPNTINQTAYSLGGNIRILTAPVLGGLQFGAALYTAQPLDLNSDNPKAVDQTLPGKPITVLGQAYVQYQHSDFLIRAGDQLINTPWLGPSDSRMIPATYRGIYGSWKPNGQWEFDALRVFEFKGRTADGFSATNLYNPENTGGTPIAGLEGTTDDGAQAVGAIYKNAGLSAELWGYQFFDFAKLAYGDFQYTFKNNNGFHPIVGAQVLTEGGDGDNVLADVSSGSAHANAIGAIAGIENQDLRLTLAYNNVFSHEGAYKNGDIVSPYTTGYATDPLYTTSMIAGLAEKGPGSAYKLSGTYFAFHKKLALTTSYARYYTMPFTANTAETDFDVTYFPFLENKHLKGLSIRNRLGVMTGDPSKGTFCYDRIMLQYSF